MTTYLFVTKPEQDPAQVRDNMDVWWSCSKTTRAGDRALVYVTEVGILFEWRVTSDAEPDEEWGYSRDVEFLRDFDPPISIQEMRWALKQVPWGPMRQNLRGCRSLAMPAEVEKAIRSLR